jgi:hypothetical protein
MERIRGTWLFVVAIAGTGFVAWAATREGGGSSQPDTSVIPVIVFVIATILFYLVWMGRIGLRDRPFFDHADPSFRDAVTRAQAEALRRDHNYIGTEHLLLGLLGDPDSTAARLLAAEGVDLTAVRQKYEAMVPRGTEPAPAEIGLTPRSKRAIEIAVAKAPWRGGHSVEDRHLLAGVLAVDDGLAARLLTDAGVDVAALRARTDAADRRTV